MKLLMWCMPFIALIAGGIVGAAINGIGAYRRRREAARQEAQQAIARIKESAEEA